MSSDAPWSRLDPAAPEPPQPGAAAAAADPPGRRAALSLMAAGAALAAAGCDGGPEEFGHPLYARPRGVALEDAAYATTLDLDGLGRGVLVRTRAGHAVKVEGNPAHPASLGATDVFAEASVLSLHDPARSRRAVENGRAARLPGALDAALGAMRADALARGGEGLRLLTGPVSSPTLLRLIGEVLEAFPGAAWHVHDPLADLAAEAGALAAFGRPVAVLPDLSRARAVLCLSADPLGEGPAQLRLARDWAAGRAAARGAGRAPPLLLVAGATPGLTSARADRRFPLRPAELDAFARAVAAALGVPGLANAAEHPEAAAAAAALRAAAPDAVVLAGRGASAVVHALAHAMNHALGAAVGGAVRHVPPPLGAPPPGRGGGLAALVAEMGAGRVSHLLHLGGCNPAYDAPAALGFAEALARVPASVHLGRHFDETGALCRLHAPLPHPLEAWGDSRAFDGTPSLRQATTPKLVPEARGGAEALSVLLGAPTAAQDAVRATWRGVWGEDGPGFEARWAAALEEGVAGSAPDSLALPLRPDWDAAGVAPAPPPAASGLSAVFAPDPHLRDGAFAVNAWLQEMPRPLTKIVWGNAVLLAPATAARLGFAPGDEVEVSLGGGAAPPSRDAGRPGLPEDVRPRLLGGEQMAQRIDSLPAPAAPAALRAPVWPAPGHAPEAATLLLGGGRRVGGEVAEGRGYDAYRLRPADGAWTAEGLVLRPTGRRGALVTTDSHHGLDPTDAARVVAPGDALPPIEERPFSLHPDWPYPEGVRAWGMAIDLDACIGCNACAVACQAENNVPVVGPAEVARGREMHWLRVERHHHGAADGPAGTFQPVPCMHCEKAPCEPVCPVNATLHDHEGLNVMVHARCVGTRTCSNNCPYKVRRFNWTDHRRALATPARNPEVPLRPRGVMEKCTYCSHRIAEARQRAAVDEGAGGAVETACQRACPTQAIAFGDLNDPGSAVSRARRDGRSYALLAELGTRPRTTYLARVARPAGEGAEG